MRTCTECGEEYEDREKEREFFICQVCLIGMD